MTLINKGFTFSPGSVILSSEHNTNYDTIYDDYNGGITNANISGSAAIADTKLAQITTASKIAGSALNNAYPVGSIYMNAAVATNPSTLLGFGTWTTFGAGKVVIGLDTGDTDFDTVEETGGSKTVDLSHDHGGAATVTGSFRPDSAVAGAGAIASGNISPQSISSDSSATQTIVQPYIIVFMWKRVS